MLMVESLLKDLLEREDIEKLAEIADEEALNVMEPVRGKQILEMRRMLALLIPVRREDSRQGREKK
jgi:hypothetical protein